MSNDELSAVAYDFCPECGSKRIHGLSGPGRMKTLAGVTFEVPADLSIPTCPDCGAEWWDDHVTDTISAALKAAREQRGRQVPAVTMSPNCRPSRLHNVSSMGAACITMALVAVQVSAPSELPNGTNGVPPGSCSG